MAKKMQPLTDSEWKAYVKAQREMGNELEPKVRSRVIMSRLVLTRSIIEAIDGRVREEGSLYETVDEWVDETLRRRLQSGW